MTIQLHVRTLMALACAAMLTGCVIPPPGSQTQVAAKSKHCEKATGSLVCSTDGDGPETGDGLNQPGVGLFNNHVPGS